MRLYKLPCGCLVERGTELIVQQCACCAMESAERHEASAAERTEARAKLVDA